MTTPGSSLADDAAAHAMRSAGPDAWRKRLGRTWWLTPVLTGRTAITPLRSGGATSPSAARSMNPARSLGPDIVGADFTGWWV
jgi:hypothetical protein